jgi:nitroreductase
MTLGREAWLVAVKAAGRAPSPHNAQPARWHLRGEEVQLLADSAGWLAAGDPTGRDDFVALGMAWEAMTVAMSVQGYRLSAPRLAESAGDRSRAGTRHVATGYLSSAEEEDRLAGWQEHRRSFRGVFAPADAAKLRALDTCIMKSAHTAISLDESLRERIAHWYDAAAAEGLRRPAVARELYQFMRFSRRDPRWTRDGLAADCLMLSGIEAWAASWLMRPGMLALLGKLGLSAMLVSERAKVLSAARVVAIHAGNEESPFDAGRRWYRFWLALAAAGFAAVPMSALKDSQQYAALLLAAQPLPPGRQLINVMRVGPAPAPPAPRSARRPVEELLATAASETR